MGGRGISQDPGEHCPATRPAAIYAAGKRRAALVSIGGGGAAAVLSVFSVDYDFWRSSLAW